MYFQRHYLVSSPDLFKHHDFIYPGLSVHVPEVLETSSCKPQTKPCNSHRGSLAASSMIRTSGFIGNRVQAQKLIARAQACMFIPTTLLNHCRSVSTKETIAMGTLNIVQTCRQCSAGGQNGGSQATMWERETLVLANGKHIDEWQGESEELNI